MTMRDIVARCNVVVGMTLCGLLASCGGGGSGQSGGDTQGGTSGDSGGQSLTLEEYQKIHPVAIEPTELKPATESELKQLIANSYRLQTLTYVDTFIDLAQVNTLGISVDPVAAPEDGSSEVPSDTNTIVSGVDEADVVKADENFLYISTNVESDYTLEELSEIGSTDLAGELSLIDAPFSLNRPAVRVMSVDVDNASAEELGTFPIEAMHGNGSDPDLYLVKEQDGSTRSLVAMRSKYAYQRLPAPLCEGDSLIACSSLDVSTVFPSTEITLYDVLSANALEAGDSSEFFSNPMSLSFEGSLMDSRRIGDTLYLMMNYTPYLPGIYASVDKETIEENERIIADVPLEDLLPKVTVNGDVQNFLSAQDCYIPANVDDFSAVANLMSLVAIDLSRGEVSSAKCLNSPFSGLYASQDAIYIGGSNGSFVWNFGNSVSTFHKFELDDGLNYRSTGSVVGTLGWDNPSFRMDATNDVLRVVTSATEITDEGWSRVHYVSILQDSPDTDQMELVGQIPNANRPNAIGKPNEEIKSVRFRDDRAYIVTFQLTDPLYVVDLSDSNDPFVAGELEVPGYSDYLHVVDDTTLLGIGYNATDFGLNDGIKLSLYDVTNDEPMEIESLILGDSSSYTPASWDHHAVSFDRVSSDELRFALPGRVAQDYVHLNSGLRLFTITGLSSMAPDLQSAGEILIDDGSVFNGLYDDRSIFYGDSVFYVHDDHVWSSFWLDTENANGPY